MDKQQRQIEEISKSCTDCMHYEICSLWTTSDLDKDEAYKYCFGRYKPKCSIPENAVVLTREEYKSLTYWNGKFDEVIKQVMNQTRKETAEKFKALLKGTVPQELLDEICKELTEGKNG